jgi:hypothetical protein
MSSMQVDSAVHLPEELKIQFGSFYTPKELVERVQELVRPYLDSAGRKAVVLDSAGGCGAFMFNMKGSNYRIADCDPLAYSFLCEHFESRRVICMNSLLGVGRERFGILPSAYLAVIGNPPYNDTTSEYKSGRKGQNRCDADLYDRDLGVSFLKSYNKLKADVICILHPLSYLIKEANFKRLSEFRENYRLVRGELFSSALFQGTGLRKFPIMVALYERCQDGMSYDYTFNLLNSEETFVLSQYQTTDGYIPKYPPRSNEQTWSPIGLYYHTFRDINSVKRNASFLTKEHPNGIVVTLENFYKYAYLFAIKQLFDPPDVWIYGNLSPLVDIEALERSKELYVSYALKTCLALRKADDVIQQGIRKHYGIRKNNSVSVEKLEEVIRYELHKLV